MQAYRCLSAAGVGLLQAEDNIGQTCGIVAVAKGKGDILQLNGGRGEHDIDRMWTDAKAPAEILFAKEDA